MKLVIRPIEKNTWSGIIRYKNCFDSVGSYITRSGARYTGLTKEDEERLGQLLGQDLRQTSEFWDTYHIKFSSKDYYIDTDDAWDELKYLFLRNHKRVAQSLSKLKPGCNYVILNFEEEAKEINVHNKAERNAITEFGKLSPDEMRKCLRMYGSNADSMSSELAEQKLYELVKGNPQKFLDKWVNNKQRETEYLIAQAVAQNVIRKNNTIYKFGEDILGYTLPDAIDYLNNPQHSDLKKAIKLELDPKK